MKTIVERKTRLDAKRRKKFNRADVKKIKRANSRIGSFHGPCFDISLKITIKKLRFAKTEVSYLVCFLLETVKTFSQRRFQKKQD